jgi:membrane associated rhomboid family serine protease
MIPIRTGPAPLTPVFVYALIAVNIAVFAYQYSLNDSNLLIYTLRNALIPRAFFEPVWATYNGINPNSYWPYLASQFMHGGPLHLLLNMWALYMFGPTLEQRFGRLAFLVFYLACGVLAGVTHVYLNKQSSLPVVGASGAIAGLIAAYAALYPRNRFFIFPIPISVPVWFLATAFIAVQLYQGYEQLQNPIEGGGIAWWAHVGGFAAGIALLPLFLLVSPRRPVATTMPTVEPAPPPDPPRERGPWG